MRRQYRTLYHRSRSMINDYKLTELIPLKLAIRRPEDYCLQRERLPDRCRRQRYYALRC